MTQRVLVEVYETYQHGGSHLRESFTIEDNQGGYQYVWENYLQNANEVNVSKKDFFDKRQKSIKYKVDGGFSAWNGGYIELLTFDEKIKQLEELHKEEIEMTKLMFQVED